MVRTKADAASRVAVGGKAPKKTVTRPMDSPSSNDKGKDNLPGNRYFPRETPSWQKKITFFYEKNANDASKSPVKNQNTDENVMEAEEFESMETD